MPAQAWLYAMGHQGPWYDRELNKRIFSYLLSHTMILNGPNWWKSEWALRGHIKARKGHGVLVQLLSPISTPCPHSTCPWPASVPPLILPDHGSLSACGQLPLSTHVIPISGTSGGSVFQSYAHASHQPFMLVTGPVSWGVVIAAVPASWAFCSQNMSFITRMPGWDRAIK